MNKIVVNKKLAIVYCNFYSDRDASRLAGLFCKYVISAAFSWIIFNDIFQLWLDYISNEWQFKSLW